MLKNKLLTHKLLDHKTQNCSYQWISKFYPRQKTIYTNTTPKQLENQNLTDIYTTWNHELINSKNKNLLITHSFQFFILKTPSC